MKLKEFSELIGLSPTTVSRALGGYPEVSEKTRAMVAAAAKEHHYEPDARARSLALGQSKTVGFVISREPGFEFFSPIFGDFISGATNYYADARYDTMISLVEDDRAERAYRALKASGKVDGIIVPAPKRNDGRIEVLKELGIPFVVHGRASLSEDYPFVDVNNKRAFLMATELLLDLGHRRIALLNGNEEMDFAWRRRQGFEEAHQARGLSVANELMSSAEMTEKYGQEQMQNLMNLPDPPSAVLCSSLIVARGAERAILEQGLRLGRDISLITHDDELSYMPNGTDRPHFTATRSSVREAGKLCAKMLLEQIENGLDPSQNHIFEAQLIIGTSTGSFDGRVKEVNNEI